MEIIRKIYLILRVNGILMKEELEYFAQKVRIHGKKLENLEFQKIPIEKISDQLMTFGGFNRF